MELYKKQTINKIINETKEILMDFDLTKFKRELLLEKFRYDLELNYDIQLEKTDYDIIDLEYKEQYNLIAPTYDKVLLDDEVVNDFLDIVIDDIVKQKLPLPKGWVPLIINELKSNSITEQWLNQHLDKRVIEKNIQYNMRLLGEALQLLKVY